MAQAFGRYWLHEKIGHGGMAEIFRATIGPDPQTFAFELAVKRLHADLEKDPKQVGTFLTEADVAKFLRHPNLVQVYEAGIIEGHVYIAMEYIWGFDLARLIDTLRRRRIVLPPELATYITLQLLRGLDYVHQAKSSRGHVLDVVHRDVTPSNIYVTFRGEVKLGDFGIAQVRGLQQAPEEAGVLRGKVHYMPPEVIAGTDVVTPRVDLWSLAVTLYEMLTARPLREGLAERDMMAGKYALKVEPVHKVNPLVPAELSAILSRALHPKVKHRPADAASFYRELKQWLAQSTLVVDAAALARFVRAGTNVSGAEPKSQTGDDTFASPEYLAPIEFSPTQRYEMTHRRNPYLRPLLVGVPLALVLAMAAGYNLATRHQRADAKLFDDFETEQPGSSDAAVKQRYHGMMQKGAADLKHGKFDAARTSFHQALEIQPRSGAAQLGLARTLYEQNDLKAAEKVASFLVQQEPSNARAHYLLGSILQASGQAPRAKRAFEQCIALDPDGQFGRSAKQVLAAW